MGPAEILIFNAPIGFKTLLALGSGPLDPAVEAFLNVEGRILLTAPTVEATLSMAQRHQPDMILLNRGRDSRETMALLSDLFDVQHSAAVVIMAEKPGVPEVVEAMKSGATDYLELPLDLDRVKKVIDRQMELGKML